MIVRVPIVVEQTGTGIKASIAGLEQVEKQAKRTQDGVSRGFASGTQRAGEFADSMGRVSTTLARSADAFGLNAAALRSLDDVMDVAELGFGNMTKQAVGFNAASIGVAGAGLAIGTAIGTWLNTFPAVQKVADSLLHTMFRFTGLAGEIPALTSSMADFRKQMAASHEGAVEKQVESMRAMGQSTKQIVAFYKGSLNPELMKRLGLTEKAVKAEEKILAANQKQKDELRQIGMIFRNEKGLVESFKAATSVTMKDLQTGGLATGIAGEHLGVTAKGSDLMGQLQTGGLATSLNLSYSQTRELERKASEAAATAGDKLVGSLGTLANQLTNLSTRVGGFAGKLLGIAASLSSGAGGMLSGIQGFGAAGKVGGLQGLLGKLSSGLGMVGSAIGLVGGLVGGIKSLFGGKSKEEKAAEAAARKQAEDDRKAAIEEAKRVKIEGLKSAQSAAESLMDRMKEGGFSDKLTGALGTLIGKVQDALLKSGLGFMASGPLRESKGFMSAQGAAGDVAQLIAGMRQGGAIDEGLLGAAGASAEELRAQAVSAAEAAGLAPAEATKAGFGAIAPVLREQLNAALASGQELDANTKALIEEAKKNGITIVADPMIESVAVQREMLGELRGINRSGGGGADVDAGFASGTKGLRLVKRDMLARIHEGEGMLVVPKDEMGRMAFRSFARGTDYERGDYDVLADRVPGTSTSGGTTTTSSTSTSSTDTAAAVEAAVERAVSKIQSVQVTNAPTVQIVDNSIVRTVEGQKRFERDTVSAVERALDQNARGLESRIERIARRATGGG